MFKIQDQRIGRRFWKVKHDAQRGALWRENVPEVYVLAEIKSEFTKGLQLVSYELNTTANPLINANMTPEKWTAVWDDHRWGMNGTGYGSGDLANWITLKNLTSPNPKTDKARAFGGQLFTGIVKYSVMQTFRDTASLIADPRRLYTETKSSLLSLITSNMLEIESLSVYDPAPKLSWLLLRPWLYCDALNVTAGGITKFPQGTNFNRVFVPFFTSQKVSYPLAYLEELPAGYDIYSHNPYKL